MHDLICLGVLNGILVLSALYMHFATPPGGLRRRRSRQRNPGERRWNA